jgi:hypothetical protein
MEQKDYILREIQKIGAMIRAIGQKLLGGKDNLAITLEQDLLEVKGMLLSEINFDFDKFMIINEEDSIQYLQSINGFNNENIEELAELLAQIGYNLKSAASKNYLLKALLLYKFINQSTKTFSFERENNIKRIEDLLHE